MTERLSKEREQEIRDDAVDWINHRSTSSLWAKDCSELLAELDVTREHLQTARKALEYIVGKDARNSDEWIAENRPDAEAIIAAKQALDSISKE